ncbi:MAG TPA: zf-HC2 domain-containing protein [Acidimicrobiales bacterium]|nr:zf-HC2 domain-containing protein [Acidimicrobiales bacterium]
MTRMNCEQLEERSAELALGILSGAERAEALAHLDGCTDCRLRVEALASTADALLELAPSVEPPLGFESRVVARLSPPRRRLRLRLRGRTVAAAAGVAAILGAGGWAASAVFGGSPPPTTVVASGELVHDGHGVGRVMVEGGGHPWVYMDVDLEGRGGPVTCVLQERNGSSVPVGTFSLASGYGSWGAAVHMDPAVVTGARLLDSGGDVLATARITRLR